MSKIRLFYLFVPCLLSGSLFLYWVSSDLDASAATTSCIVPGSHVTIQTAVNDLTCDIIEVGSGTFQESITINRMVTIQGSGAISTTISGGDVGRAFYIEASGVVTLAELNIVHGFANKGGGIYNIGAVTVANSMLSNNSADDGTGGGIFNSGVLTITDSMLSNNWATFSGGSIFNTGTTIVNNTTLTGNSSGEGGAIANIANYGSGTVTVNSSTISSNSAYDGGGIYNEGTVTVTNSTLSGNLATDGAGIDNRGTVTVTNSTLSANLATYGGGIYNTGTVTVTNSTLSANRGGTDGGGIENRGTATVTNSTLSANTAGTSGGGIQNCGSLTVTNSTLSGNTADHSGGGIYNDDGVLCFDDNIVNFASTILANNLAYNAGPDCWGDITSQDYNLVENTVDCNITGSTAHNINALDPLLGPLQDNGGLNRTHALLAGSPAIDAGNNAICPTTDQRGVSRPRDGDGNGQVTCDIGAFELEEAYIVGLTAVTNGPTILGQPTTFTANVSAGSNVTYTWNFGDHSSGVGAVVNHTYGATGLYFVTVTATNLVSSQSASVAVLVAETIWTVYLPVVVKQ